MFTPIEQELAAYQRTIELAKTQIAAGKAQKAELVEILAACAYALDECAKMLRHLNCPGHAAVADIHKDLAHKAIAKAKGE